MANEEIKKWFVAKYGIVMDEKIMEDVYNEEVLHITTKKVITRGTPIRYIADLQPGVYAIINVIRGMINRERTLEVCAVCHRMKCDNPEHTGKIPLYTLSFDIGDATGTMEAFFLTEKQSEINEIKSARFLLLMGKIDVFKDRKNFKFRKYRILTQSESLALGELLEFNSIHGGVGGINKEDYMRFISEHPQLNKIIDEIAVIERDGRIFL